MQAVRHGAFVAIVAAVVVAAAVTRAPAHSGQPTFSARSDLVVLHVSVTDRDGQYVPDLAADAFGIAEDGVPQRVEFFAHEDAPATVALIIDGSGSMARSRERVLAAVGAFAQTSNQADEFCALVFNDVVRPALPLDTPFTSDPGRLRDAVGRLVSAYGRTALHDAILDGLSYVERGENRRTALVVLSDGGDNASEATFDQVLRQAQATNTIVYTVAIVDRLRPDRNPKRLKAIAMATGGASFEADDMADVPGVFATIASDLRHTYTIGYVSTSAARSGVFHRVRVSATTPDGRSVRVRAREGYVVGGD
jgi:Ca-activated chloride channel family protein